MERPVFVSLLAVAVVAVAGLGALNAGMDVGRGANGGGPTAAGPTAERTTSTASLKRMATPIARTEATAGIHSSNTDDSPSKESNPDEPLRSGAVAYPPGTSPEGIENARKLLRAHTRALSRTGFAVDSRANATVLETGMRIDATTRGGARVAPDMRTYYAYRTDAAGPLQRRTEGWYDGSVEHQRKIGEFGSVDGSMENGRSVGELAGRPLLAPHLRGGSFERVRVIRAGEQKRFVFTARSVIEERTVIGGLPKGTTEIRSYEGRIVVDSAGRVRSFSATVEYVIGGEPEIHHLEYDLTQVGDVTIERPEWAEETTSEGTGARGDSRSRHADRAETEA